MNILANPKFTHVRIHRKHAKGICIPLETKLQICLTFMCLLAAFTQSYLGLTVTSSLSISIHKSLDMIVWRFISILKVICYR